MADITIPLKRCSRKEKCVHPESDKGWLPATKDYFHTKSSTSSGLNARCKACVCQQKRGYYLSNTDEILRKRQDYVSDNRDRVYEQNRQYRLRNLAAQSERNRQYRETHKAEHIEYQKQWYKDNLIAVKEYRRLNREQIRQFSREYRRKNRARLSTLRHKRRTRELSLPNDLTDAEWQRALSYFNHCCAVCGRQLKDLFGTHTVAMDHWIPITKGGGTTVGNIVPLCHGLNGCNNRKHSRDPLEFLKTEFGKRRAAEILTQINAYFEWTKEQGGA